MTDQINYALTAYDSRDAKGLAWQDHGPTLANREQGQLDSLFWTPGETIVWIVTRDERAIRGFNNLVEKMMALHGTTSREIYEKSVHNLELIADAAGHHHYCPRMKFEEECECTHLGRVRYCRCTPAHLSWPGNCECVPNALKGLFRAVEDGLPLRGKRAGEDGFKLIAPTGMAKLSLFYGDRGLQLLPNFAEVVLARADVVHRWPAESVPSINDRPAWEPELGRPPAYEDALTIFSERLRRGVVKTIRLQEVRAIHEAIKRPVEIDTITKKIKPFYAQIAWEGGTVANPATVIKSINDYLDDRRRVRVEAAKKRLKAPD